MIALKQMADPRGSARRGLQLISYGNLRAMTEARVRFIAPVEGELVTSF